MRRRGGAPFSRSEMSLIATAAAIVFTRVFAFSLTTLGFTEYAKTLVPAGTSAATASILAGIAFGAYGVTMALAQLATGFLSDRVGRRPVLLGGTAVFVAGAAASALSASIWPLIAGRLLQGLGGVSSSAMAAVGETVPAERRTTAMAMVGVPAGIAVFLGFIVGPPVASAIGFANLFWVTAALGLAASLPLLAAPLPAPLPGLAQPTRSLSLPVVSLALAGFAINFAMMAVMFDFQHEVLADLGDLSLAGILLVAFVAMGIVSRVVDRRGAPWLAIMASLVALAAAAPVFRLGSTFAVVAAAGCIFFAAHAILSAVLPSQVSRLAGRSGGLGHGIQLVVAYLGSALGAFAAGFFSSQSQLVDAFVVLAGLALVAAALVGWSFSLGRHPTSPSAET